MVDLNKVREPDLWYTIGYIATDGCLSNDGRHIDITSKDKNHLVSIKQVLHLKNKIGIKYRSKEKIEKYSRLQFSDTKFYKHLLNLGITPKKSLSLGVITVENKYFGDFLRGVIDGDGNISSWIHKDNQTRQWCLRIYSASYVFLEWIKISIRDNFHVDGRLYTLKPKGRNKKIYRLKFGKKAAKIVLLHTYYSESLALERKLLKVKEIVLD